MLDNSTTVLALAQLLHSVTPLTVITNFHTIMHELSSVPDIRLIMLGGEYAPRSDSFTGLVCEAAINAIRADIVFLSTTAVTGGIGFQPDQEEALVKRTMLGAAAKRVLLLDHTKLGRVALHRLAPLRDFDLVIVDAGVDEQGLRQLRESHVPFEIAPLK
jgi:DeoR/GlpR family transcriptional regulator of sugar metabolism